MLMQLTEQNCSHQPALKISSKIVQIILKNVSYAYVFKRFWRLL